MDDATTLEAARGSTPPSPRTEPSTATAPDAGPDAAPGKPTRREAALPWLLATAFAIPYLLVSLLQHRRMLTHAYDLGLFEQVVRNYAYFHAPVSDIDSPGYNVLGEHFSPILALLGPVYRVFPSAMTLLVVQALLLALSVVPMTRIGMRVFGSAGAGAVFGIAYGLSWGLQSAVAFEFHEICFAVPMIAFALERLLRGEYRAGLWWLAPTLLVKEDLGLTFAATAVFLHCRRERRLAVVAAAVGVATFAVVVFVALPALNPHGTYGFWGNLDGSATGHAGNLPQGTSATSVPFTQLLLTLPKHLVLPSVKWMTIFTLLLPTGFLALRSPLVAMAVPTLLWRFTSSNIYYWGTQFHYSAVLMPIVFAAFADAVPALRESRRAWLRRCAAHAVVIPLAVSVALSRDFPLMDLLHEKSWIVEPHVKQAEALLATIPDNVNVSSTEQLAPRLTSRDRVTDFPHLLDGPGYVVADNWDGKQEWVDEWVAHFEELGFTPVASAGGVVLLKR